MAIWIRVEHTKKLKRNDFGETTIVTRKSPVKIDKFINVRIKKANTKTLLEYAKTLTHELGGHAVFSILQSEGLYQATIPSEEEYCIELENAALLMWHILKEKKKK